MKIYISLIAIFFFLSCTKNEKEIIKEKYYYIATQYYNEKIDTIPYNVGNEIPDSSCFLGNSFFLYGDSINIHVLKKYKTDEYLNDNKEKVAGTIFYTLDSLGVIYNKNVVNSSFGILSSNNDSINRLLSFSLGHIIRDDFSDKK